MKTKNPKKVMRILTILCIFIGLAAVAVGVVAAYMEEYIIAVAMLLVAVWQIFNVRQWKKTLK